MPPLNFVYIQVGNIKSKNKLKVTVNKSDNSKFNLLEIKLFRVIHLSVVFCVKDHKSNYYIMTILEIFSIGINQSMKLVYPHYRGPENYSVLGEIKALCNKWRASIRGGMRSQFPLI